jgi:ribosomal protein S18 acetylase RimI-like enzyme
MAVADAMPLRALVLAAVEGTPYAPRQLEMLDEALAGTGAECRALVAARDGELVGVALFGEVAGTRGAAKVHLVAVTAGARLLGIGARLVDAAVAELAAAGARLAIAEVPDDPRVAAGRALLVGAGFREESRVADFYADGVALVVMRREVSRGEQGAGGRG